MSPSSDLHRLGNIDTALTKRKHKHIIKRSWKKKKNLQNAAWVKNTVKNKLKESKIWKFYRDILNADYSNEMKLWIAVFVSVEPVAFMWTKHGGNVNGWKIIKKR